jgi:hypothetical protein
MLALTTVLTACAAATPGYVPPSAKSTVASKIKGFESGNIAATGVYEPSAAERALDCKRLTGSMHIIIARLKDAPNRPKPSDLALKAQSTMAVVRGPSASLDVNAENARERARLTAFNGLLADKKCKPLNLDAELGKS